MAPRGRRPRGGVGGRQWSRYCSSASCCSGASQRRADEATKLRLAAAHPDGREAYTSGKDATVERLLHVDG